MIALAALLTSGFLVATPPKTHVRCTLHATRTADTGLPGTVIYVIQLGGECKGVEVKIRFVSTIGGIYPPVPYILNDGTRTLVMPGNPEWWYPVKVTRNGPVSIPVTEAE